MRVKPWVLALLYFLCHRLLPLLKSSLSHFFFAVLSCRLLSLPLLLTGPERREGLLLWNQPPTSDLEIRVIDLHLLARQTPPNDGASHAHKNHSSSAEHGNNLEPFCEVQTRTLCPQLTCDNGLDSTKIRVSASPLGSEVMDGLAVLAREREKAASPP